MHEPTYQTVKLMRGKHTAPDHGVCVMELASMVAGEPFTDHPSSVSRSIGAFLRVYNDTVDDLRRQDLYSCASMVVGTADSERTERDRVERLIGWADEMWQLRSRPLRFRRLVRRAIPSKPKDPEAAARYAVKAVRKVNDEAHSSALALVAELVDIAPRPDPPSIDLGAGSHDRQSPRAALRARASR